MKGLVLLALVALSALSGSAPAFSQAKPILAKSVRYPACGVRDGSVVIAFGDRRAPGGRNPRYAGVSHGDDFFYLNDPSAHARFTPYTEHTRQLVLSIASQQALAFVDGVPARVKAFARPGTYAFHFMDNLETEPDSTYSLSCQVRIPSR